MRLLEERIIKDGLVLSDEVLKVDSFLNHQIDVRLLAEMAKEWKRRFSSDQVNKILTIEASGIAIACIAAEIFDCPLVFAKKALTRNIAGAFFQTSVTSFTHETVYEVIVSKRFLGPDDRVLIIDDFLANGAALTGLVKLVKQAGATLVGCGIAIEKSFQKGGDRLRKEGIRIESLARIRSMNQDSGIEFEH